MSNIKEVHDKPRLHVSVNLLLASKLRVSVVVVVVVVVVAAVVSPSCVRAQEQYR